MIFAAAGFLFVVGVLIFVVADMSERRETAATRVATQHMAALDAAQRVQAQAQAASRALHEAYLEHGSQGY